MLSFRGFLSLSVSLLSVSVSVSLSLSLIFLSFLDRVSLCSPG
jgi:hypothetical protein